VDTFKARKVTDHIYRKDGGDGGGGDLPGGEYESHERQLRHSLRAMQIIDDAFTGSVVIHIHEGKISDLEKTEKGLRKRRISQS